MMKRRLLSALLALATMLSSANVIAFAEGSDTTDSSVSSQTEPADGESGGDPTPESDVTDDETVTDEESGVQTVDENGDESTPTPTPEATEAPVLEATPEPEATETPAPEETPEKEDSTPSTSEPSEEPEKPGDTGISEGNPENNGGEAEGSGAVEDAVVLEGTFKSEQNIWAKKYITAKSQKVAVIDFSQNEWWPSDLKMGEGGNCTLTFDDARGKFEIDTSKLAENKVATIYVKEATEEAPTKLEEGDYPVTATLTITIADDKDYAGEHTAEINGIIKVENIDYVINGSVRLIGASITNETKTLKLDSSDGTAPSSVALADGIFKNGDTELKYGVDYTFKLADDSKLEVKESTTEKGKYTLATKEVLTEELKETVTVTPVAESENFGMNPLEITVTVAPFTDKENVAPSFDAATKTVYYKVGADKAVGDKDITFTVNYGKGAYATNNAAVKTVKVGSTELKLTDDYTLETAPSSGQATIKITEKGLKKLETVGSQTLEVTFGPTNVPASAADAVDKAGETITFNDAIIVFTKLPELAVKDAFYSYTPGSDKNVEIKINNGKAGTKVLPIDVKKAVSGPTALNEDAEWFTFDGETLTIINAWLHANATTDAGVKLEISFDTSDDKLEVTINNGTDKPDVTGENGKTYNFEKDDKGLHADYIVKLANLGTQNGTAAVKSVTASFYASNAAGAALIGTEQELKRVDHWSLSSDTGSGRTLTINKEWFASIAANAAIYDNLKTNVSVMKLTIVAYAKDGSEATIEKSVTIEKPADSSEKTFKVKSGVEGLTLVDENKPNEYNLLLTIKKNNADSIIKTPADLQEYFQTEDGKDLYTIAEGLKLEPKTDSADTITQWNTILIPAKEQTTSVVYELKHSNYKTVTLNVRVADYTKEQTATPVTLGEDKAGAGVTTTVEGGKAIVNINNRASSDAGEFDANLLFTGLPAPFDKDNVPEKLTAKVNYKTGSGATTEEQKDAVKADGSNKIVAVKSAAGVPLVVEFVSPNGYTYGKAEITVNTVVNEGTLSITPVLYEGQDKTTAEDQKKEADKYKAIYSAIGLNYSSNIFKYMDESFRLAELKDMDKVDDNYAAKIWFPVTLAEGQTFKYKVFDSLKAAQEASNVSLAEVKAPAEGGVNKAGFVHSVAIIGGDKEPITNIDSIFVRYDVTTETAGTAVTTTSIQEVPFSVVADTSVKKAYEPGVYELYKAAADKTYAEMGITVSGTSIVYNKLVNKAAPTLKVILKAPTLNGVLPESAMKQDKAYAALEAVTGYDKTLGGIVVTIPVTTFNDAATALPKYIRWDYPGEASTDPHTYKYTEASFKYDFTTIGDKAYADAAFGTKGKEATNIALADGSKTLPKDKLYAGDTTKGIEFTSTVSYVNALGKEATDLTEDDKAKTTVTYSAKFNASAKTDSDDLVDVTFDQTTNGGAPGTKVKADIAINKNLTKGGTLTIYATFHNPKIMTDLEKSVSYKITPNQYVKEATPSATTAQVVLKKGKASYTPKVKISPSTKAYDKDHVWTVTGVSETNTPITSAAINAATGKADFTEAGTYTLKAEYKTKGLDTTTDKGLFDNDAVIIKVQVYGEALKTFALKNSREDKVVDLIISDKDASTNNLVKDIPAMIATNASNASNVAVTAESIKPDYIINYSKNALTTTAKGEPKIVINNESGKITVNSIDEGGTSATVTALLGGKTLSFKINAYATATKDKVQLVLLEKGTSTVVEPKKVKAGVEYSYEFRKTSGDKAKLDIANSAVSIEEDGKKITEDDFYWNKTDNTVRFNAPVSGKINFTFKGDPAARKGAYSVSTNSKDNIVEPLTVSLSDPKPIGENNNSGATFDGVYFERIGADGAILHFDDPNVTPSYANDQFTWTVSDSKYATIKANKEGGADLTWKKDSEADNKTITVTAKSKGKSGISASYTFRTYDALANIGIASNPKTVLVNVADGAAGTLLPIVGLKGATIEDSYVTTYDKKKSVYNDRYEVTTYTTEENDNIVTLRASSTAKAGKYYLALKISGKMVYLPITTKLTKVTGDAVKVSGAKAGVVNTAVYGYKAPITLAAKNVDPLNVLLEMTDTTSAQDFALVREDGVWYAQYNSMEAKTGKVDLNLTWSVPGVGGGSGTVVLKLTLKPTEKVNQTFTVMKEKVNTFTGYVEPFTLYFTGANAEYINQNAIVDAAYLTDGKKSSFASLMDVNYNDEKGAFELSVKGEDESEEYKANLAKLTKGTMTATLNLPLKGTDTVATGVITLTVNTDAPKGIKAVITGSMPQIKATDEIEAALRNDGAVLTFTKPADWAYTPIADIQLPEGFVRYPDGKPDTWRIGYTGNDYSAAGKTIAMKLAFDKKWPANADEEQPKAVVDVTVSKPAASYTQQTHFIAENLELERSDAVTTGKIKPVSGEDTFAYVNESDPVKAGTTEYLEFATLKGMTLTSSDKDILQVNSFTNKMYVKEKLGTAVVTISKPGYVEAKLQVTVTEGGEIVMKAPEDSDTAYKKTGDYAYTYTYDRVTSILEGNVPLATFTDAEGLTVSIEDGQNSITFNNDNAFVIGNDTPADKAVKVTLKKPYAKDVTIDFTVKSGVVDAKDVTLSPEEGAWEVKDGVYTLTLTKGMTPSIKAVIPSAVESNPATPFVFAAAEGDDLKGYDDPAGKVSIVAPTDGSGVYKFKLGAVPVEGATYKFVGKLANYKDIVVLVKTPKTSMKSLLAEGELKPYLSEDKSTLNLTYYSALANSGKNTVNFQLVSGEEEVIKTATVSTTDQEYLTVEKVVDDSKKNTFKFTIKKATLAEGTLPKITLTSDYYENLELNVKIAGPADMKPKTDPAGMTWDDTEKVYKVEALKAGEPLSITFDVKDGTAITSKGATNVTVTKGADGKTYTLKVATVADPANETITFSANGYEDVKVTVVKTVAATLPEGSVTIEGIAKVGVELTAEVEPAEAETGASYKWERSKDDGSYDIIRDQTSKKYTLTADDVGKKIKVTVTGGSLFTGTASAETAAEVAKGDLKKVEITGTAEVDSSLGVTFEPSSATVDYQWQMSDSADGPFHSISGATENSLALTSADHLGKYIRVIVTAKDSDTAYTGSLTSDATAKVTQKVTAAEITGTAKVNETLTASVTPAGATVTYQWQRITDNTPVDIEGETNKTYVPIADDVGKTLQVVVNGTGDYTGSVTSAATAAVAAVTPPAV